MSKAKAGRPRTMWTLELVDTVAGEACEQRPQTISLRTGTTSFGRESHTTLPDTTEVLVPSLHISRKHASITVAQDAPPVLADVSSTGCRIFRSSGPPTGEKVRNKSAPLAEGDEIRFGLSAAAAADHIEYRYVLRQAAELAEATPPVTAGVTRHRPTAGQLLLPR